VYEKIVRPEMASAVLSPESVNPEYPVRIAIGLPISADRPTSSDMASRGAIFRMYISTHPFLESHTNTSVRTQKMIKTEKEITKPAFIRNKTSFSLEKS
jgi:hypothetical protein